MSKLIIAAAGSGKTEKIVNLALNEHRNVLITTYTDNNVEEIKSSDKNLSYNNSYLLSSNNKGILNQITNNSELDLDITKEQLRYNIILTNKKDSNFVSGSENKSKKGRKKKGNDNKGDKEDNI